jgi:hypothetical protein
LGKSVDSNSQERYLVLQKKGNLTFGINRFV